MSKINEKRAGKPWPKDCIWPEPLREGEGPYWEADDVDPFIGDPEVEELMERLEIEADLDMELWEMDLSDRMNLLRLDGGILEPVGEICRVIGYDFINENLLRQAFTRRAFAVEHGLSGCNEELEFLGDSVLNSVVTKEIVTHLAEKNENNTEAPFETKYDEGDFTRIRAGFVSKEHLSAQATKLGLDRYILYGTGEEPTESSREDMIEALIGAVTIDSGWDNEVIGGVIDRLICVQLTDPDRFLKKTYYEIFNSWHQRRFGQIPDYEVHGGRQGTYDCTLRYFVPENDKGIWQAQRVDMSGSTRSIAREHAAHEAYSFVLRNGLWMNLKDAGITPDPEKSINQLQELYQKKYIEEIPEYSFKEMEDDRWECNCISSGFMGWGRATNKTKAKKRAAYMVLVHLMESAGISRQEWREKMYEGAFLE